MQSGSSIRAAAKNIVACGRFEKALMPAQMKTLNALFSRSSGSVAHSFTLGIEDNITLQTAGTAIDFVSAILDKVKLVC